MLVNSVVTRVVNMGKGRRWVLLVDAAHGRRRVVVSSVDNGVVNGVVNSVVHMAVDAAPGRRWMVVGVMCGSDKAQGRQRRRRLGRQGGGDATGGLAGSLPLALLGSGAQMRRLQ